ncbi:unnamed protein product [Symbiodinium sp. CCMP2592]|nr:unnamed protein product [Symbiodinium sp. CCMP2592]
MPLYEERLINPLSVRFSQDRMWEEFSDGRPVEETVWEIAANGGEDGYDLLLSPPFPSVEIVRLRQQRREGSTGIVNERGERLYGEESWFTFDNRRLYCLQRAALLHWPRRTAIVAKVLFDMPDVRSARHKFRSTSDGRSIKVSRNDGSLHFTWSWEEALPEGASLADIKAAQADACKCHKEELLEPLATRRDKAATIAERFGLGTAVGSTGSSSSQSQRGQDNGAGKQLLSLLQGGPVPFPPADEANEWWPDSAWESWQGWDSNWWAYPQADARSAQRRSGVSSAICFEQGGYRSRGKKAW